MPRLTIGDVSVETLEAPELRRLLDATKPLGGRATFPTLHSLDDDGVVTDLERLMDELHALAPAVAVTPLGRLVAILRDDAMAAIAASAEG